MKYVIYRDPSSIYQKCIERFCLRLRLKNPHMTKDEMHKAAQAFWREKKSDDQISEFLKLREGEKPFAR